MTGRVEKNKTGSKKKEPKEVGIVDKIEGAVEKVVGVVQGKPGKKVRVRPPCLN